MQIKTIPIQVPIVSIQFDFHKKIKKDLLKLINENKKQMDVVRYKDGTRISYCDWDERKDSNRPWFKLIKTKLSVNFTQVANHIGFFNYDLRDIWYQQYEKEDWHNWHTHSNNYTGVYYVEYDEDCKTELYDSINNKKFYINAKEGDLVFFPSFVIHRSPQKINKKRKTIISWNIDFSLLTQEMFDKLNA